MGQTSSQNKATGDISSNSSTASSEVLSITACLDQPAMSRQTEPKPVQKTADNPTNPDIPSAPIQQQSLGTSSTKENTRIVAAIDFGTTSSTFAFSLVSELKIDPRKIQEKKWNNTKMLSSKGSTCILIGKDGQTALAFGDEAESLYCNDPDRDRLYLFNRFKMILDVEHGLNIHTLIKDVRGKCLPGIRVFSLSIRYLVDDLKEMLVTQLGADSSEMTTNILWVLTVPAIWNETAKQFMREAAVQAGIPGDQLIIALEPETAALYCRHLPPVAFVGEYVDLSSLPKGAQYMVVDAGGGTVDTTIHEIVDSHTVKEVVAASGGPWGGVTVDEAYYQFLERITGPGFRAKLRVLSYEDDIDLVQGFEVQKRAFKSNRNHDVTVCLPLITFNEVCKTLFNEDFASRLNRSSFGNTVTLKREKLIIPADVFRSFFTVAINKIANHIKSLLKMHTVESNCKHIVMVGAFSESTILQEAVKSVCPERKVIIPGEAGVAIVKGAVIFGYDPSPISHRVSKFTYGINVSAEFDPLEHPISKQYHFESECLCADIFYPIVKAGETLKVGHPSKLTVLVPVNNKTTQILIEMFAVKGNEPTFVTDEGCMHVGMIEVPVGESDSNKKVHVFVVLGGTEMQVECTYLETGKTTTGSINFLE